MNASATLHVFVFVRPSVRT